MRRFALLVCLAAFAIPAFAGSETFKDVAVVDSNCSMKVAADPDSHPRACALKCAESGFVVITKDQKILKLDKEGNQKVLAELKASDKKDHLRVDVTGDIQGETLKVKTIKLL